MSVCLSDCLSVCMSACVMEVYTERKKETNIYIYLQVRILFGSRIYV